MATEMNLYDLIKAVREDFVKMQDDPEVKARPLLKLKEMTLEVSVMVSKAGKGGLKFILPPVIPAGIEAGASMESQNLSKIRLVFEPLIGDERARLKEIVYSSPLTGSELSALLSEVKAERDKQPGL